MVRLSKHTADEMQGRGITLPFIEAPLTSPDETEPDPVRPELTRSFKSIPEFGGRTLRVVHRPDGMDVFAVTAHWDRRARRQ